MSLQIDSVVRVGSVLQFSYPTDNRVKVFTRLATRRFFVRSIRDLDTQPLHPLSYKRRPDLRRGKLLLHGHDIEKQQWRYFYLDSTRLLRNLDVPLRRLAFFDPCVRCAPLFWFGTVYTDSTFDTYLIRTLCRHLNKLAAKSQSSPHLIVAAFPIGALHADSRPRP